MQTKFLSCVPSWGVALAAGSAAALPLFLTAAAAPVQAASPAPLVPGLNRVTGLEISSDARGTHIIIEGSQAFTPEVHPMGRPSATVIMVPGQWDAGHAGLTSVRRNGVWTVRYGQYADGLGSAVRIVANTRLGLLHTAQSSPDHKRWEVTVWAPGVTPTALKTVNAASAPKFAASVVASVVPAPRLTPQGQPFLASVPSLAAAKPEVALAPTPAKMVVSLAAPSDFSGPLAVRPAAVLASMARRSRPAAAHPVAVFAAPSQDSGLRRVSLDFVAADINDVLKALSLQSGVNIVTGADVKGNITVTLKQVSLGDALDMVTRLSGFKYARFGPTYVVGTPASVAGIVGPDAGEKREEPVTEFIPFRYNTMVNVTRALGDRFPGLKLPTVDKTDKDDFPSRPKTLIVTDTSARVAEVRDFIVKMEQSVAVPSVAAATEVYQVRYASPVDLLTILGRLVPTLSVQLGPSQGFSSGSSGASASFAASGPSGGAGATSGASSGGAATGGGGTANPAGAQASGGTPTVILLTGATADIVRAREILGQVDLRTAQIQYEARVVDINRDDQRTLGLRYNFGRTVQVGEQNFQKDGTVGGVGTPVNDPTTVARNLVFGALYRTPYSINANLDALEKDNHAKTLANPNLSALDGQPAVVFIGDQIKYVINIQQTPQGQNIQTETATVGVTLKVTGKSSPDGTITLYVHPEVSSITSFQNLPNGISLPQIGTRFVDTTIRVKDGETIGIGGLIQESDVRNITKVPFLGDVPFFGQLFRSNDTRKARSEVVIFITSRILKD